MRTTGKSPSGRGSGFPGAAAARLLECWRSRLPPGDRQGAGPRILVVGEAGEQPAQFHNGRQLAALFIGGADLGGIGFINDKHDR